MDARPEEEFSWIQGQFRTIDIRINCRCLRMQRLLLSALFKKNLIEYPNTLQRLHSRTPQFRVLVLLMTSVISSPTFIWIQNRRHQQQDKTKILKFCLEILQSARFLRA